MNQLSQTKIGPAQIVAELREVGLPDLQQFLTVLYSSFKKTGEWKEAPEALQDSFGVYYLELLRALELMEKAEFMEG
jgi:hypothetical protein